MPAVSRRFDRIPPDDPRLLEGSRLFNAGEFFASHEVWESLWHEVAGPERELLQGLIQLTAAYHHRTRGNATGARYLYTRGRARLARWAPRHAGIGIAAFLAQIDRDFRRGRRRSQGVLRPQLTISARPSRTRDKGRSRAGTRGSSPLSLCRSSARG